MRLPIWITAAAGFLASAAMTAESSIIPSPDRRIAKLEEFFKSYDCHRPFHIKDYLDAADRHDVDYRLLPALSVRESTCGAYSRLNNFWGWDSARSGFASVEDGIEYITGRLAEAPQFRNLTLEQKLMRYNPRRAYVRSVIALMDQIE